MNSKASVNLNDMFSSPVQYKVPIYQRRYVWDVPNWEALWRDILAQIKDTDNTHFTGIIVIEPMSDPDTVSSLEVIDGQQRLTTFQIILCVIRDIFQSNGHDAQMQGANALIVNRDDTISRYSEEARYKLVLTEYDGEEFEKVVKGEYGKLIPDAFDEETNCLVPAKLSQIKFDLSDNPENLSDNLEDLRVNVFQAYDYFYEWIRGYMEKDFDFRKLDDLLATIQNKFTVVKIELEGNEKSEKIFESINATGRKLSEFDYLRNNLFLRAGRLEEEGEEKRTYRTLFYEEYWHFENNRKYWTMERLEEFLKTFLIAKLGPKCFEPDRKGEKNKKEFEVYQDQYLRKLKNKNVEQEFSDVEFINQEFSELNGYREDYKNANPSSDDKIDDYSEIGIRMQFYRDLRIQSFLPFVLPFVLHLKNELRISDNELKLVYKSLESRIMRRLLFYPGGLDFEDKKVYDQVDVFFLELVEPSNKKSRFTMRKFVDCLDFSDWRESRAGKEWPNEDEIKLFGLRNIKDRLHTIDLQGIMDEVREQDFLSIQHRAVFVLSYTFYRIEKHIDRDNKNELDFEKFSSYEPKRILSDPNSSAFNILGNFTFLEEKVTSFDGSILKLNQELREIKNNNDSDIEAAIHERTEILFNYFCQIWPDKDSIIEEA